jgi:hypothetical protein
MFGKYNGFVNKARVSACMHACMHIIFLLNRELEQDKEVRRHFDNFWPSAHYFPQTEFAHWWLLNVSSRYRFVSRCLWILTRSNPHSHPHADKTARHEAVSHFFFCFLRWKRRSQWIAYEVNVLLWILYPKRFKRKNLSIFSIFLFFNILLRSEVIEISIFYWWYVWHYLHRPCD